MTLAPLTRPLLMLALAWPLAAAAQQDDSARQKELDAARADLQRAAKRLAELSGQAGADGLPLAIDARIVRKPRLGVLLEGDEEAGVRITGVTPESGAAKAGLKAGDRLLRVDGKPIAGSSADARVEHAREALSTLKADTPVALAYQRDGRVHEVQAVPGVVSPRIRFGSPGAIMLHGLEDMPLAVDELRRVMVPELQRELRQLQDCKDGDCKLPVLADAFRWSGLNLAPVDARLGRYFGAERGVLVLGREPLPQLEPGDVIQEIEGRAVDSPQDAMRALTARKPGEKASAKILRDRQPRTVQIEVPERLSRIEFLPALGAARAADAPRIAHKRRVVTVDGDGDVQSWEDDGDEAAAPPATPRKLADTPL